LEVLSVSQWVSWEVDISLVNVPGLVETIVAMVEDNLSVVGVVSTLNIKAVTTAVSQVSSASWEVGESLSGIVVDVLSDNSVPIVSQELTSLVGDGVASS